jgi:hypothetical protein
MAAQPNNLWKTLVAVAVWYATVWFSCADFGDENVHLVVFVYMNLLM